MKLKGNIKYFSKYIHINSEQSKKKKEQTEIKTFCLFTLAN